MLPSRLVWESFFSIMCKGLLSIELEETPLFNLHCVRLVINPNLLLASLSSRCKLKRQLLIRKDQKPPKMATTISLFTHLFILFLVFVFVSISSEADTNSPAILLTVCSRDQVPNPESFDVNFVSTMELIYQNITKHGFGFASSNSSSSDIVFGLGQCFGYLSSVPCQLCYAESRVKLPHCLPSSSARIYLDGCFLRYSNHNFLAESIDGSDSTICGNSTVGVTNSTSFSNVVNELMRNLTLGAEKDATFYKVGSAEALPGLTVYGMAECWRALNQSTCRDCLENAKRSVGGCLPKGEGLVLNVGCVVRYSMNSFYVAKSENGDSSSSSARRRLAIALGCLTVSSIGAIMVIFWIRRRASTHLNRDFDGSDEIIRSFSSSPLSFKYEVLRNATDNFNQTNKLGQGGYGSVYKGILPDGREIAVKRLFFNTRQWVDQFFNEITLINQVQHKNLVKLLGCSVEGPESLLVYEYLCNSSLDHFLFDSFKKNALDWERRFEIIIGTAEGLAYLHTAAEVRIIHRDVKASNILLDERFKPKIADFGLARYFAEDQSHLSTGLAGTFGYMAPEYIIHGQLTEKADVYGYGVVVLEIITGQKIHNSPAASAEGHSLTSLVWQHFNSKTLIQMLDPSLRGNCSDEEALKVFHVGLLCTQASPSLRPPMWKVVEMLTSKSKDLPLPTQPPFINAKDDDFLSRVSDESHLLTSSSKNSEPVNQMSVSAVLGR